MDIKNRAMGCMVGGAIGDALGYPVEFMSLDRIRREYGVNGITRYHLHNGVAEISDDTQMSLCTANGLITGMVKGEVGGMTGNLQDYVWDAYREWYQLQCFKKVEGECCFGVSKLPEMLSWRAPGNTCIHALRDGRPGVLGAAINDSKGCGGVMRVAPVALLFIPHGNNEEKAQLGATVAALTHGHSLGFLPAAMLAYILSEILYPSENSDTSLSAIIVSSINKMKQLYGKKYQRTSYLNTLIQLAVDLAETDIEDCEAVVRLGEGWVAEETLAIAVYCCLKHQDDFEKAIVASVNHSGDSDSTGAVAGNIIGAWLGYQAIPSYYLEHLELRNVLEVISADLCSECRCDGKKAETEEQKLRFERYVCGNLIV